MANRAGITGVENNTKLQPSDEGNIPAAEVPTPKRRLSDVIEAVFLHALEGEDFDTCADLIAVLVDQRVRYLERHGADRRQNSSDAIARMTDQLLQARLAKVRQTS